MDSILKEKLEQWLKWDKNEKTRQEINDLVKADNIKELSKLLCQRMIFGTAGLRSAMGAGFSRMNDLTMIQTAQGFLKYMLEETPEVLTNGVIIGYDARYNSKRFAELTANIFLRKNIPVFLFSKICPTPFVAYGVLYKKCTWGIMVTASHNPKNDNGYKVFFKNGSQIIGPHDSGIASSIEKNLVPWEDSWDTTIVYKSPVCHDPLESVYDNYMNDLLTLSTSRQTLNPKTDVKFTYTAMHGVGYEFIVSAFGQFNFVPCIPVKEQVVPDPEFPTVIYPNPEEGKSALDLSIKTANESHSNYILANDPDADRLAVAEKLNDTWTIFTGNELGCLFGWWLIQNYKKTGHNTDTAYVIASVVSTKLLKSIAEKEKINYEETLTGFKYMGNKSHDLISRGKTVLFAFEEAIGFMCGTKVLDKDGISAAVVMAEMIVYLRSKNLSLCEQLNNINEMYGIHVFCNSYYECHEPDVISRIFQRIRNYDANNKYPNEFKFDSKVFKVQFIRDLTTGFDNNQPNNIAILPVSKSSQMITFTIMCDQMEGLVLYLTLRTSGTEPKIKYYSEFSTKPSAKYKKEELKKLLDGLVLFIVEDLFQPKLNNLKSRQE